MQVSSSGGAHPYGVEPRISTVQPTLSEDPGTTQADARRFGDPLARMHALAKASTLGILLILTGAAINLADANDVTSMVLAGLLHVLSSPPTSNMVSRAVYLASGMPHEAETIDEGAEPLRLPYHEQTDDDRRDRSGSASAQMMRTGMSVALATRTAVLPSRTLLAPLPRRPTTRSPYPSLFACSTSASPG